MVARYPWDQPGPKVIGLTQHLAKLNLDRGGYVQKTRANFGRDAADCLANPAGWEAGHATYRVRNAPLSSNAFVFTLRPSPTRR